MCPAKRRRICSGTASVLASVTAFELLALVLVVGSIAALFGWAGGAGARLLFAMRLDRVEGVVMQLLNRLKGAKGGEQAQVHRERLSSAEKEAEALAARLMQQPPLDARRRPRFGRRARSPADLVEEEIFADLEAKQTAAREKANGKEPEPAA